MATKQRREVRIMFDSNGLLVPYHLDKPLMWLMVSTPTSLQIGETPTHFHQRTLHRQCLEN